MSHEQLISRNRFELSDVIACFNEVNSTYRNYYGLFLDHRYWELIDLRLSKTIIRHDFKHFNQFVADLKRLNRSLVDAFGAYSRLSRSQKPKSGEIWSIKYLLRFYDLDDQYMFHPLLKNYIENGLSKKIEVVADHY